MDWTHFLTCTGWDGVVVVGEVYCDLVTSPYIQSSSSVFSWNILHLHNLHLKILVRAASNQAVRDVQLAKGNTFTRGGTLEMEKGY